MSGKYVYLIICYVMSSAHSYQLNKTVCEGSLCLYLYESKNSRVTWDASRRACTYEGLEMLSIESSQTQTIVDRLLQDLPQDTQREVWIGGRRSSDDTWRYMNGTEFHPSVIGDSDSNLNCIHVKLCKDRNPEYEADECDEKRSISRVLCQHDKSETGECRQSGYQFGDKCYVKTPYDGSDPNKTDWYSGQTYCSQSPIQGDLAYSYLDDNSSINSVLSLFNDPDGCAVLWFGVRRRIWFWRTVSDSDGEPINYFNWITGTQIQPSDNNCIYVNRTNGNKWHTQSCNNYLPYFVCMKVLPATTSPTTATTFTSDHSQLSNNYKIENATSSSTTTTTATEVSEFTTAATNQTTKVGSSTFESESQQKGFVYIISVSVVGILILLGAVGLAVFFIIRKKNKQIPGRYVNEHFHKSSANRAKAEDPEYADIEQNGADVDDVIDPYGVTGGSETPKKIKHSVAPSGELYALPRRKENAEEIDADRKDINSNAASTVSDSKGREMKYREAPSGDLYTVPEKKRNCSKDEQSDGIKEMHDDNVYSLAKSIDE